MGFNSGFKGLMPTLDGVSGGLHAPTALFSGKGYPVPTE